MKYIIPTSIILIFVLCVSISANGTYTYADRAEFDETFDTIARNFGAVEGAYYTFTLEFERIPVSIQEMEDTGHLRVAWENPYTGEPVMQTDKKNPGDLSWELDDEDPLISTSAYYIDWNDNRMVRWMTKSIWIYTQEELKEWIFEDGAPREEQLVRVYCLQLEDALETYKQRFGTYPDTYEDLTAGDVNVTYINPITSELVKPSKELSQGDFWYKKIDDRHFAIVGWGYDEPVYFVSNDRTINEFEWEGEEIKSVEKE
jgi:hypothetical protein